MFNMKQLHNEQKQWLFDKGYVDAKTLDACVENGWEHYYVNCFNWLLDNEGNNGWYHLYLQSKENGNVIYNIELNLRKDYQKLMLI